MYNWNFAVGVSVNIEKAMSAELAYSLLHELSILQG